MKTISAGLKTHIEQDQTTLCTCWKVEMVDGTEFGFTDHVEELLIDSLTYEADSGFSHSAIDQSIGLSPDNLEIAGVLDSPSIDADDVRAGLLNDAKVWIFTVNYLDLTLGAVALDYGYIGEITMQDDDSFIVEFRSLMQRLDQEIGRKFSRFCKVKLGSTDCGVDLNPADWVASTAYAVGDIVKPTTYDGRRYICSVAGTSGGTEPTWNTTVDATTTDNTVTWICKDGWTKEGTVTTATSNRTWIDSTRTEAANWFQYGVVTWTSGLNIGQSFDVKSSTATGTVSTVFSAPFTVATGDGYSMNAGCNHLLKLAGDVVGSAYTGDCRVKFDNVSNFQGEPEITGTNFILAGAAQ